MSKNENYRKVKNEYSKSDFNQVFKDYFDRNKARVYLTVIVILFSLLVGTLLFTAFQITYFTNRIDELNRTLNEYIYNEYYYPDTSIEHINAITLNTTIIHTNETTLHYKGCDSFIYEPAGIGVPSGWNKTLPQQNQYFHTYDERWDHAKIFSMTFSRSGFGNKPQVDKWIGESTYGTIEYWYAQGSPGVDVFLDEDHHYLWDNAGNVVAEWGNKWRRFSWYNGTDHFADNYSYTGIWTWHNVKVEFRCEGAIPFANLTENCYNLYYDHNLIYGNCTFQNNASNVASISFKCVVATCNFDAISWSWGILDISGEPYQLGDKDTTWPGVKKQVETYFYYPKNYKNIKNFTYSYQFITNMTLSPYEDSYYAMFNYYEGDWEILIDPVTTGFNYTDESFFQSSIRYLNPSSEEVTHIKTILITNQFYFDYDFRVIANCSAWFWIP